MLCTSKVPRMTEVFPQAVVADNLVFLSGTTGVDPTNGHLPDNFEMQAIQALENIKTILE